MKNRTGERLIMEYSLEYTGRPDPEFEADLIIAVARAAKKRGWRSDGSGYDLVTNKRDLRFCRKKKKRRRRRGPQLLPSRTSK